MARLFEHQGKALLQDAGIRIPRGQTAGSPEEVEQAAVSIGAPVVIKAQTWSTSRAASGGILFADSPVEAREKSRSIFGKRFGTLTADQVLVEEKLDIEREYYAGVLLDDSLPGPRVLFHTQGGSGIEEKEGLLTLPVNIGTGLRLYQAANLIRQAGIHGKLLSKLADVLVRLVTLARNTEARSAEINPIVITTEGDVVAADCRLAIDDYAVFRHPELGIRLAREISNPPTKLDQIAHDVEQGDYRGTFYFIQLEQDFGQENRYVGFHGAGGGGSMMSMDALLAEGFKPANFCDTSGNPPASKVYRAARIILAQKNIVGYFASGSGVASQEQIHSARGLVKAFREVRLNIPAVIRLGGNLEDEAVRILEEGTRDLPAPVEGYKRDDPASFCAKRFRMLVESFNPPAKNKTEHPSSEMDVEPGSPTRISPGPDAGNPVEDRLNPESPAAADLSIPEHAYRFSTVTQGFVCFDHMVCKNCKIKICIQSCIPRILKEENGVPVLNIPETEAAKGKCTECLACEIECRGIGKTGALIILPIPGLE